MAKVRENPPRIHDGSGNPTGESTYTTLFVMDISITREKWKAFETKCESENLHPFDQVRNLIDTYTAA